MANTSSVRLAGLIWDLEVTIGGHAFRISAVVLQLNAEGACPLLLGRPWLRTVHIKRKWKKNTIALRTGKAKVGVPTQSRTGATKELPPLYAESINIMDGLANEEVDQYLEEHPKIVPLFEVDFPKAVAPHIVQSEEVNDEPDQETIR